MLKEKVAYWSGPAAAIGGVLWLLPWSGWLGEIGNISILLMNLVGLLLIAIGLAGLYLHLRASGSRGSTPAFGLVLVGALLVMSPVVVVLVTGSQGSDSPPLLVIAGVICLVLGLAAMGISAISHGVLGRLSFVPLALAGAYVGYLISFGLSQNNPVLEVLAPIFIALTMLCWLLLGAALWIGREMKADTVLQM